MTERRTYTKDTLRQAEAAWEQGEFDDYWQPWRRHAAQRGILYPPSGSGWDSWAVEHPSQRAIIARAIDNSPATLTYAISHSRSWVEVIAVILDEWKTQREAEVSDEKVRVREARAQQPTIKQATYAVGSILSIIGDSVGATLSPASSEGVPGTETARPSGLGSRWVGAPSAGRSAPAVPLDAYEGRIDWVDVARLFLPLSPRAVAEVMDVLAGDLPTRKLVSRAASDDIIEVGYRTEVGYDPR